MKLFEHKDFDQAILGAEQHFRARKLRPAIIEKDYYVTEALRIIAAAAPRQDHLQGRHELGQRLEPDPALFGRHRHFSRSPRLHAHPRKERHRPGTQEAPRCSRRPSRAHLRRGGEPNHRRIRAQRPLLLYATLRRHRRSRQPRPPRSRHRQRPRAHRSCPTPLLSRTVP